MKRFFLITLALILSLSFSLQAIAQSTDSMASTYEAAIAKLNVGDWVGAVELFETIPLYQDAAKYTVYAKSMSWAKSGSYDIAIVGLQSLGDFLDCQMMITYVSAEKAESIGDYEKAQSLFSSILLFKDSFERAAKAHDKGIESNIQTCLQDLATGKYDPDRLSKLTAQTYLLKTDTSVKEQLYTSACTFLETGDPLLAYYVFRAIRGYKDVDNLLATDHNLLDAALVLDLQPGKYVSFGHYPQTAAGIDNTPIEWLVLARDGQKVLLLSRYGLDAKPFNIEPVDVIWEQCTLRNWLNNDFLNKAFSSQEQGAIALTYLDNSEGPAYKAFMYKSRNGGNNTADKVFLLSYAEANKYLGVTENDHNNTKSRVEPTPYAIKQSARTRSDYKTVDGKPAGVWRLRSPGCIQYTAAHVSYSGSLDLDHVSNAYISVRPALWVNLDAVTPLQ